MTWTVHKFGGTSVVDASCIRRVADIIGEQPRGDLGVVVSAMKGVTDDLLGLVDKAVKRQPVAPTLQALRARHEKANVELLGIEGAKAVMAEFDKDLVDIEAVLNALTLVRAASNRSRDLVAGYGEIWSARQIAAFFKKQLGKSRDVLFVNARDVLVIEHTEMGPVAAWELSRPKLKAAIPPKFAGVAVITGFVASDKDGLPTTLGRNGSDYSASIFGALLDADQVHIWTDVDGVMSGDPRQVPEAKIIDEMSYNEAMELAYFGAKVIHPQTMAPAVDRGIPLWIRNTFNPTHPGTKISASSGSRTRAIKGISGIDKVALVNLEGAGMIGVPGTADRLFGALRDASISVMMISQGSSEHSICFAVREDAADQVRTVVERAFAVELSEGLVQRVGVAKGCAIVAVVGDDMAGMPGIAGRFFGTLGSAGINVRAIAQGASERNISAVIDAKDMTRAIRAVHSSFYLSAKTVSIGVLGPGLVGGALLDQLARAAPALRSKFNLDLRVRAIGGSKVMALDEQRLDLGRWRDVLKGGAPLDTGKFANHIQADYLPHAVIIDCTASQDVADRYAACVRAGGTLYFAGNGGSAADAQHLATEYVVRYEVNRPAIRAVALSTDTSLLTACANDMGFDEVFARQVEALAKPPDVLVLHSTSGESPNVIRAAQAARARGVPVVAFAGGSVREVVDHGLTGFVVDSIGGAVDAVRRIGEIDRRTCRDVFERRFTATRMAGDYLNVFRRILTVRTGMVA